MKGYLMLAVAGHFGGLWSSAEDATAIYFVSWEHTAW